MKKPDASKHLLNEVLPDPKNAGSDLAEGSPRSRTVKHLKRILATSLAVPLAAAVTSCHGYVVVDPVPPPYIKPAEGNGYLSLKSIPDADIEIDGKATGLRTPQPHIELSAGTHAIKLTSADGKLQQTFNVEISAGATTNEERILK